MATADDQSHDALRSQAERYGLTFIPSVEDEILDADLVANLPVEWARTHCLLPVRIDGEPCVLVADPSQTSQPEDLGLLIGETLRPIVCSREEVLRGIERCYFQRENRPEDFLEGIDAADGAGVEVVRSDDLLEVAEQAPVTQFVNLVLLQAVKQRASDIHFEPAESRLRVRYRIDGTLYEQASPPKHLEDALVSRLKVMARMDIAERRLPQDGMARVRVGEREIDIRVSTVPVPDGERVVLRLLDKESALLPLLDLGMTGHVGERFESLLGSPNGMIVVSGPTGSGKTTTLYAALGQLDATRRNIMTIEDPIEYKLPDIGQIQVKPKIGLTFAMGLRHILRQDPDIVLVGETRDLETADIAIRASLTGHLVFTTLHTNDAPGAILRLIDMGVESYLLASCLRGVLAQRLVRRLCPACRREGAPSEADLKALGAAGAALQGHSAWLPTGCDACLEGYAGRTGLFELMAMNPELQGLVRDGGLEMAQLRAAAEAQGMHSLIQDGLGRVLAGETTVGELATVAAST